MYNSRWNPNNLFFCIDNVNSRKCIILQCGFSINKHSVITHKTPYCNSKNQLLTLEKPHNVWCLIVIHSAVYGCKIICSVKTYTTTLTSCRYQELNEMLAQNAFKLVTSTCTKCVQIGDININSDFSGSGTCTSAAGIGFTITFMIFWFISYILFLLI